ncbi:MAG: PaaI family thioesterase [Dehalococcoidia bacterium]|nr:PaaI family thioesterase [Dehalococcoidia bacterium]
MFDPAADRSQPAFWLERQQGRLPGLIGVTPVAIGEGWIEGRLDLRPELRAPNGFLHAATVIALADTLCGYGCTANLPEGASGFTTIEVKSNYLGTATEGSLTVRATLVHGGRTTQVWDAPVVHEQTGKTIALFRCTQMVLWPK